MAIAAGTRLGPYEVLSSLGVGGMGEVYRAQDTRLDRVVAIKVLASHFAEREHRRRRFQREARAISRLNHPHIATLYDVGSESGADFLVMELVEGQTLADRLTKGALPLDEALRDGVQIADALDKAHRQGIVHRDLKPSNIMLTKEGVKLLDFGLAKFDDRKRGVVPDSSAPTEARKLTEEGAIVGTLQYMAPEQLEGKDVDQRADLFALGGILYEMVTGGPAFEGKSPASLIAAILDHEPGPVSSVEPTASPLLDHTIARCLEKDPDERWQSALDLKNQFEFIRGSARATGESTDASLGAPAKHWAGTLATALGLAFAFLIGGYVSNRGAPSRNVVRASIGVRPHRLGRLEAFPTVIAPAVAISRGGEYIAWVSENGGMTEICLRAMNESHARVVEGSRGAYGPFFSPDERWLGYLSLTTVWKIPIGGGAPVSLFGNGNRFRGASWGDDGYIYFAPSQSEGIWRVPESGGEAEKLTAPQVENREKSHRFPEVLPGGKGVLFTIGSADIDSFDDARIEVLELDTRERRVLIEGGTNARFLSTGHIIYARAASLVAVPFDLERLEVIGTPVSVLENVATSPHFGPGHFAVSEGGLLVFAPGGPRVNEAQLVWVDRQGVGEPLAGMRRNLGNPRISPEGNRVLFDVNEANVSIWVHELSRGSWTRLVSGWDNVSPIWEPNGRYVTFGSNRTGPNDLFRQTVDASAPAERLTRDDQIQNPDSWSPDGTHLAFWQEDDIWILSSGDVHESTPLLNTRAREMTLEFSPDGRSVAYVSDETGTAQVYVQPFPGPGPRISVSTTGGTEPAWAPSGEELYYREVDKMMMVEFEGGKLSRPRMLFDASRYERGITTRNYDISPDGDRFLMVEGIEPERMPDHLTLVVNWFDELERHFEND